MDPLMQIYFSTAAFQSEKHDSFPFFMDRIPINFERGGKQYSGYFVQIAGSGDTSTRHLYDHRNFYLGRLRIDANDDWVFDESNPKDELKYLARFFGNYIAERI